MIAWNSDWNLRMRICLKSGVRVRNTNRSPTPIDGIGPASRRLPFWRKCKPDMQTNVYLPQLELTMTNVTVAVIRVKEGDWVKPEQPLLEVESEKALSEVPAPKAGCVRKILVQPGQALSEKALLCILTETAHEPIAASGSTAPTLSRPDRKSV